MVTLYVVSAEEGAGKTAICAGVGRYLLGTGKKVGFLRPLTDDGNDADAAFMKRVLTLSEAVDSLSPPASDVNKVKEAHSKVAQGKDVVIVESLLNKSSAEIARALDARVIIVEVYTVSPFQPSGSYPEFGENLLGIVLNKVPASQLKHVQDGASAQYGKAGVNLLGVLPEDRALAALTVGEIADCVQGKILNDADKSAELVENFMLGAMVVDSGLEYFGRKKNKAAVVRGDRPDMQLAALETSTRCLVLSGSTEPPIYNVLQKAENRGIPIIQAESDTSTIIASLEEALSKTRFCQEKKLSRLGEIMRHLDLKAVA